MELLLGSHVREHGHRIGRLAGFEVEPDGLRVRRLIISPDGELGSHALTRPLTAVSGVRDGHEIELQSPAAVAAPTQAENVILISKATRLSRAGHALGRCVGTAVDPSDHRVLSVFGRHHWWSRRFRLEGPALDCSTPGEIRVGAPREPQAA
jgi:hypothetical protein